MKFSKKEIKDLFTAWVMISVAFAVLFSGGINAFSDLSFFLISLLISGFSVGVGFLFHELMHKAIAQKYGLWAEFRAFYKMLFFALGLSFFGFILAAPGAVVMRGGLSREKNGKISVAGPLTNVSIALFFLVLLILTNAEGILRMFFTYGLSINSLLALFNMIPLPPFDGYKVYIWNKGVYVISILLALVLFMSRFAV